MLTLAATRDELGVVADQWGNPTYAPDIADALLRIVARIETSGWRPTYAGLYHLAGTGDTCWHGFATEIFETGNTQGRKVPHVNKITTVQFPTPAQRPANSRLDCGKLEETFGIILPEWQISTKACVKRLLEAG